MATKASLTTRITARTAAFGAVLAIGLLSACGSPSSPTPNPEPTTSSPAPNPEPTTSSPAPNPEPTATLSGEIWQWALGRNVWTDPALAKYTRNLGRTWGTDVDVQSEGFKLSMDASGVVTSVTLFNDENELGFPGADSNYSAYQGTLPMGLSWSDTPSDLNAVYGAPNQAGGYGLNITFNYKTRDGYQIEVAFKAGHESELPGSPLHWVSVARTSTTGE